MNCPDLVFDGRSKKWRICNKDIYGMTGLQELNNYQKHLRSRHHEPISMMEALERRAESGQ